jgi:hypothetical protein
MFTRLSPAFAPDDHGLVSMYRAAQKARIARIRAGVRQRLEDFAKAGSDQQEHGFVVRPATPPRSWRALAKPGLHFIC